MHFRAIGWLPGVCHDSQMKRTGDNPCTLTEIVEQLLIVYTDRSLPNAAALSDRDRHSRRAALSVCVRQLLKAAEPGAESRLIR